MLYLILKSLHIVFMVSYFAGLFYLVRIFVYYKDTDAFEEPKKYILREQYLLMARRLWNIITAPAGVLMFAFGVSLIVLNPGLLFAGWFHLKLTFLLGLAGYHFWSWKMVRRLKSLSNRDLQESNIRLRQYNEIATFILFLVVFTVVLKHTVMEYGWYLLGGFVGLVVFIMFIVKRVNRHKKK